MLFKPKSEDRLGRLAERLRLVQAVTPDLMSDIIAETCVRLPIPSKTATTTEARINRLIADEAWTDAGLALIALELPRWQLRRLVCEDGQWLCSLSQQPGLPVDLDETADADHEVMPLAILGAFLEAKRAAAAREVRAPTVPKIGPTIGSPICCDNFA